jgi:carbon-monoxide dehydrogenase small subunit
MMKCSFTVNGETVSADVPSSMLLVEFLRSSLQLRGTHQGCDTSQCGCCVVHLNGRAIKSCTHFAWQADGGEVVTIEGLASDEQLHPMQDAFHCHHALQCGYCTPGMIMSAVDMVRQIGSVPDQDTIRERLDGNICRCTGYHNIVMAIQSGAEAMLHPKESNVAASEAGTN